MESSPTVVEELLLSVNGLDKTYLRGRWTSKKHSRVEALRGIHLQVPKGSTLALIGASGSGKSSLARCIACLERPDSGEIWFAGTNLVSLSPRLLIPLRRQIQLIFQDAASSLNPRLTAGEIIAEPLLIAGLGTKRQRRERARELLEQVGIPASWEGRYPSELSGGQRQRLAIARALALEPKLIILDEALTGLDLAIQAQMSNLLTQLQVSRECTYLYIAHDLGLVRHLADQVVILDAGRIVEAASSREFFSNPRSPQGLRLLEATLPFPVS